jgi:hypothetical protein
MSANFLEQGIICLDLACTCMKTYKAHAHVPVIGRACHLFDIFDMGMLPKQVKTQFKTVYQYMLYTNIYQYIPQDLD